MLIMYIYRSVKSGQNKLSPNTVWLRWTSFYYSLGSTNCGI